LVFLVEHTLNALGGVALIRSESLVTNEQPALVSARFRATIAAEIEAEVVAAGSDVVVKAVEVVTAVEMAAPMVGMEMDMPMATVETRKEAVTMTMASKLRVKPTITLMTGVCKSG
jgi:hypothetical protein